MNRVRTIAALIVAGLALSSYSLRADVRSDQKAHVEFAGMQRLDAVGHRSVGDPRDPPGVNAEVAHILVVPASVPVSDVGSLIALAKKKSLYYGSAGVGSPPHLSMELFARIAGVKLVHVPYKGVGGAMPDLLAGRVQVMSMAVGSARPYLKTGQLKPLAAGAKHRLASLPDLPTAAEAGVAGWEMSAWFGLFAPRGIAPEIVRLLNDKSQGVLDDPKSQQRLAEVGAEPIGGSVESFVERYRADYRMWGQFLKETGIKQEN